MSLSGTEPYQDEKFDVEFNRAQNTPTQVITSGDYLYYYVGFNLYKTDTEGNVVFEFDNTHVQSPSYFDNPTITNDGQLLLISIEDTGKIENRISV